LRYQKTLMRWQIHGQCLEAGLREILNINPY
jgi:hypothetical protein